MSPELYLFLTGWPQPSAHIVCTPLGPDSLNFTLFDYKIILTIIIIIVVIIITLKVQLEISIISSLCHELSPTHMHKQQVILVRLRTGHNRLNSHMHCKLKLAPSPTCPCGREEQTVEHVLQRCPLYEATREDVWPVSTSLTTKLYGCKQELEKTTSFISRAALIM